MKVICRSLSRREFVSGCIAYALVSAEAQAAEATSPLGASGDGLPFEQIKRLIEALQRMGEPISTDEVSRILELAESRSAESRAQLDAILHKFTLIRAQLDKSGHGQCTPGGASQELAELGWRAFLVRVVNPARLTGSILLLSRSAIPEGELQPGIHDSHVLGNDIPEIVTLPRDIDTDYDRGISQWMGYRFGSETPADEGLEGASLEYHILQLYSQLGGVNSAPLAVCSDSLRLSTGRADSKGFTAAFECRPATPVCLTILDSDARGAMASLIIRDEVGRLYPAPAHRLEPDLGYQPQIYRADGETLRLPAGRYRLTAARGPEYLESYKDLVVSSGTPSSLTIDLKRWIEPAHFGWYSGDPHIHPEGQSYGMISKYGLTPESIFRQVCGEGLSVGSILIWTGGYYYEKQFLTGHVYEPKYTVPFLEAQRANNTLLTPHAAAHNADSLIRYDAEQAAFPSNRLGHLMLLRLKNHDFPGVKSIYDWPSWNLPILEWARAQGASGGYAHIGNGMGVNSKELPNYEIPALADLGANECLVDVAHGSVDFVAGCEGSAVADLNVWYHMLNCGFQLPMIGETDFLAGRSRVGAGRTYVRLDSRPVGDSGYAAWVDGIRAGRLYFGDGRSHFTDVKVNNQALGSGVLRLAKPGKVVLSIDLSCRLDPTPFDIEDRQRQDNNHTYWHIERARIGSSRTVPLEVIVNSRVVERREVLADGTLQSLSFAVAIKHSSWMALRILPSAHTAPLFVSVANQPIRASRRSVQWCLDCVDVLWSQHANRIRASEREAAAAAWDYARNVYRRILNECTIE